MDLRPPRRRRGRRLKLLVEFEVKGPVATITLNRPEKMNAMDAEMYESISSHLREIDRRDDIRVGGARRRSRRV